MWRYEFDDTGGYDCLSSAYLIYDKNDNHILTVDTRRFPGWDQTDWDTQCKPLPEAEEMAQFIVASLNVRDTIKDATS